MHFLLLITCLCSRSRAAAHLYACDLKAFHPQRSQFCCCDTGAVKHTNYSFINRLSPSNISDLVILLLSACENICGVSGVIISTKTRDFIDTSFWFRIHFDMCGLIMSAGASRGKDSGGGGRF